MAPGHADGDQTQDAAQSTDAQSSQAQPSPKQVAEVDGGNETRRSASPAKDAATVSDADKAGAPTSDPPLPDEDAPPLPDGPPPEDDGWTWQWDANANSHYFYNRLTGKSQWENPRLPAGNTKNYGSYDRYANSSNADPATSSGAPGTSSPPKRRHGGYNPAIHGNYDPNADYAQEAQEEEEETAVTATGGLPTASDQEYSTAAHFNRFTGRFQHAGMNPDYHNDENKSKRQMSAFFDVDAAANSHDGRSLKAERRGKTLSKKELKAFKEKRRDKKEEKRRAWLRD